MPMDMKAAMKLCWLPLFLAALLPVLLKLVQRLKFADLLASGEQVSMQDIAAIGTVLLLALAVKVLLALSSSVAAIVLTSITSPYYGSSIPP